MPVAPVFFLSPFFSLVEGSSFYFFFGVLLWFAFVGPVDFLVDFAVEFGAAFQGFFLFEDFESFVGEDFEGFADFFAVGFQEVEADVEEFVDDF